MPAHPNPDALRRLLDAERASAEAVSRAQLAADARVAAVEAELGEAAQEASARRAEEARALVVRLDAEHDARAAALRADAARDAARYDAVDEATVAALGREVVGWLLAAGP